MAGIQVVEKIDPDLKLEELTKKDKDDLFTQMILGKDVISEADTSRGKFMVKYPKQRESLSIGKLMAFRRNGLPVESFDAMTEKINLIVSTLDVLVVDGPEWYKNAKATNKSFSFMEVPDEQFLEELYQKAYYFRSEVHKSLNVGSGDTNQQVSPGKGPADSVGVGLFEGLAEQHENEGVE
ncbi:hypothetical protein FACS189447_03370 [Spirochaetia bacterium]|nr:hypothetical protein FACS189447_03370 [Spirochaetia bacterium]